MHFLNYVSPLSRSQVFWLIGIVFSAFIFLAVTWRWSLGVQEHPVVRVEHVYRQLILDKGENLEQAFKSKHDAYRGAQVYSQAPFLDGRTVELQLLDKDEQVLAFSRRPTLSYLPGDDTLVLRFRWPEVKGLDGDLLKIRLTLVDGKPLPIKVSSRTYDAYTSDGLKRNGAGVERDLGLTVLVPDRLPSPERLGMVAGVVTMLVSLLIWLLAQERHQWLLGGCSLLLLPPLALGGFWFFQGPLGIADWDYYFSLHENYRRIVTDFQQVPFWNPYTCGGTAGLADPEFPGFSPRFPLELLFGVPTGLRATIWLTVGVTGLGMMMLSRVIGLSPLPGFLVGIAAAFSSVSLLEIVEGHVNVFAAMWIPWVFYSWYKAYQAAASLTAKKMSWRIVLFNKYVIWCAAFLALTFYGGGIYLLMYTGLAFLFLLVLVPRHKEALLVTVSAGMLALGLAAMKLVPVLLWLRQFPDDAYASSTVTLPWLVDILFGRHLHGSYILFAQDSGWHEYGAYIGVPVAVLAVAGIFFFRRRRLVVGLLLATLAAVLLSSTGPGIQPIFDVMWFFPRSNISRFILFAVLPITLLAGFGFEKLRRILKGPLVCIVIGLVAVDLMSLTYQLSSQSFVLPHRVPPLSPAPAPIAFTNERFDELGQGSRTTRTYDATLAGYGTTAYCSVLGPKPSVALVGDEDGGQYIGLQGKEARATLVSWTPNKVTVRVQSGRGTTLTINTNYAQGWRVAVDGMRSVAASEKGGRVAVTVPPGEHEMVFSYVAPGFWIGVAVTLLTVCSIWDARRRVNIKV